MLPVVQLLNSFTFATLPLRQGILNIHTPERLFHVQHGSLQPYFQIRNTSAPIKSGPYAIVAMECSVMGRPLSLRVFTDKPEESNVLCINENGTPTTLLKFRVGERSINHHNMGHCLAMSTKCYRAPRLTEFTITPLIFFLLYLEGAIKHKIPLKEDKNLALYRAMVLNKGRE
jgi:hypothetical protein